MAVFADLGMPIFQLRKDGKGSKNTGKMQLVLDFSKDYFIALDRRILKPHCILWPSYSYLTTVIQVNNYEIVANFFHISHNLT